MAPCQYAIFFPSFPSLTYVQKSFLPVCDNPPPRKIWCQSSIKFDRLRPFPIIHRLLSIFPSCSSSIEFDQVRIPCFLPGEPRMLILGFLLNSPTAARYQARSARQGKQRTATDRPAPQADAGAIRIKTHSKMSKINIAVLHHGVGTAPCFVPRRAVDVNPGILFVP